MAMTRKRRRIILIGIGAGFVLAASLLVGVGMRDSIVFFFSPSEIAERAPAPTSACAWAAWWSRDR